MRVAITGASGFVGGLVLSRLTAAGHTCVTLGRRRVADHPHRQFSLGEEAPAGLFEDVDCIVHAAWDLTVKAPAEIYLRNVAGSTELLRAAATAGVSRIVFISSMSAYRGTKQIYGRSKLEVEELVRELGGLSLRPGLVWGGAEAGGMAGAVARLTALPVVPVLGGEHSYQYTVHQDDVAAAISLAVEDTSLSGVIGVAEPGRVPLPALLRGLAREAGAPKTGRFVHTPWRPVYAAMRLAEAVRAPTPLRADSVLGLTRPAPDVPSAEAWPQRGLALRPFPAA